MAPTAHQWAARQNLDGPPAPVEVATAAIPVQNTMPEQPPPQERATDPEVDFRLMLPGARSAAEPVLGGIRRGVATMVPRVRWRSTLRSPRDTGRATARCKKHRPTVNPGADVSRSTVQSSVQTPEAVTTTKRLRRNKVPHLTPVVWWSTPLHR